MAKILCGISGVEFKTDFVSLYLNSREYAHPIFYIPQKKLFALYSKYVQGELNEMDSYLLYCAFLNSTELVEWRVPAQRSANTQALIANNLDKLVMIASKIQGIKHPRFVCARISIGPETSDLANSTYWIKIWENSYNDFISGYKGALEQEELTTLEHKLDRLIKDVNANELRKATLVSDWAEKAGNFPKFEVTTYAGKMPCSDYWKLIIRKCTNEKAIFNDIPKKDLQELIEHCEENIEHGSIYAHDLMKILREGAKKQNNYLGLGDIDLSTSTYQILGEETVESANLSALIQNAPKEKPEEKDYPSKLAYLRAKLNWSLSLSLNSNLSLNNSTDL